MQNSTCSCLINVAIAARQVKSSQVAAIRTTTGAHFRTFDQLFRPPASLGAEARGASLSPLSPSVSSFCLRSRDLPVWEMNEGSIGRRPAAVCGHGRMNVLAHTAGSLLYYLVEPLQADLFISAALDETRCPDRTMCSNFDRAAEVPHRTRSVAMLSTRDLNQSHRLIGGEIIGDGTAEEQQVRDKLRGTPFHRRFGEWAVRIYFDLSNQRRCMELVARHERLAKHEYRLLVHIRLDVMLFRPLAPATAARLLALPALGPPTVWKPWGDDHGGLIDLMGFANRPGADLIYGVVGNASRHVTEYEAQHRAEEASHEAFFYPERLTSAQMHSYGAHVRRFAWPHCRIDEQLHCRYPGESQRLLRAEPRAAPPSQLCGGVLRHLAARSERRTDAGCCHAARLTPRMSRGMFPGLARSQRARICIVPPQDSCQTPGTPPGTRAYLPPCPGTGTHARLARLPSWQDEWKGSSQCALEWDDPECCDLARACEAIANGLAPENVPLPRHTPLADGTTWTTKVGAGAHERLGGGRPRERRRGGAWRITR